MRNLTEMLRERAADFPDVHTVNQINEDLEQADLDAERLIELEAAHALLAELAPDLDWPTVQRALRRLAVRHHIGSEGDRTAQAWALHYERVSRGLDLFNPGRE